MSLSIKPSNLLLDAEQHLWVADFGLAMVGFANESMSDSECECFRATAGIRHRSRA
jgi:hypothetical protein